VKATHAYTINGRTSLQLKGSAEKQEAELRRLVHVRDGVKRYSLSLWVIPDGKDFDDVDVTTVASNEVLAADEVADVFVNYFRTGSVPDRYSLREIQL
jgi:hypothetical protein